LFTELAPGPVLRFGPKGKVLMANKAATEIFARGDLKDLELAFLLPGLGDLDLPSVIREGRVATHSAQVGKRSFDFIVQGVPDLNAGQIYGTDITERLRLHEELVKQERLVTIGKTVADVAHSMKNIFTPLRGGLSLLERSMKAGELEQCKDCRESYEILRRSVSRLSLLLANMLDFSKSREPVFEAIDMEGLFKELAEALQFEASRSNVVIECKVAREAKWFRSDQQHLYLALLNLGGNSVDAMRDGGTLRISASRQAAESYADEAGKSLSKQSDVKTAGAFVIEVSDSGCGIPMENLGQIFEAFFSTKQSKGTGLGLYSVKQFVEAQGGEISVTSKPGGGTTFRLRFKDTGP
ncbi:MAG: ATP-binding protein, partial [bacterium]